MRIDSVLGDSILTVVTISQPSYTPTHIYNFKRTRTHTHAPGRWTTKSLLPSYVTTHTLTHTHVLSHTHARTCTHAHRGVGRRNINDHHIRDVFEFFDAIDVVGNGVCCLVLAQVDHKHSRHVALACNTHR